jgi:ABC-type nitrate/sulfonate/bicarbonate transport system permease component
MRGPRAEIAVPARLAAALLAAAAFMAVLAAGGHSSRALPTPAELLSAGYAEFVSPALWVDVAATLGRLFGGLLAGTVVGLALGVALGISRRIWAAVEPTFDFLRAIPPILTFPLLFLAFGYGESARVLAVAAGTAPIVLLCTAAALARVPRARVDTARLLGLRGPQLLTHLYAFELLPGLFVGLKLGVQAGLTVAVVSEMLVGAPAGLGARALAAQIAYRGDLAWIAVGAAGALGTILSNLVCRLERRIVRWKELS